MNRISALLDSLNTGEQWIFRIAATAVVIGCIGIGTIALSYVTEVIPEHGGTYIEGTIGYPTSPNPILATTSTDQTLVKLVYSGLLRKVSWNNYQPDLGSCVPQADPSAIQCTVSPNAYFHDGRPVTADDILFTFETIQKTGERSPLYSSLVGVTLSKKDENTVLFQLPKPFSGFEDVLTTGIIPEHIWKDVPVTDIESQSKLESMLVGSGPYIITKQTTSSDHINTTKLKANPEFISGEPYIRVIELKYYSDPSELVQAFNDKIIDGFVLESETINLTDNIEGGYNRIPIIHPDIYGLFTKSSLETERQTLLKLEPLVRSVQIAEFGFPWSKPLPPWSVEELLDNPVEDGIIKPIGKETIAANTSPQSTQRVLVTVDQESLVSLASTLSKSLQSIRFPVEMRVFDFSGFKNSVVPKRSFNFLVFGQRYRHASDAYAYWNSSERSDPGLNVTETIDTTIDTYTNSLARQDKKAEDYSKIYSKLDEKITSQRVFLPLYLDRDVYIFRPKTTPIHQILLYNPTVDRLNSVANWYLHTSLKFKKHLWPI